MYIALPAEELLFLFRAFFFPGIFICILGLGKLRHGVIFVVVVVVVVDAAAAAFSQRHTA